MNEFISSDTVIFHCELKVSTGSVTSLLNNEPNKIDQVLSPKLNFNWVFLDKGLSDVKLKTACGKEIPSHRVVLATASPVFKAMFNHDMLENKSQLVDMIDISHEATVEMLRYIYTGSVETSEFPLTIDLLAAADKYQLEELKNKCGEILSAKLSTGNGIETLSVAVKYNMDCLKQKAADFIKLHINKF
ncbi:speckle-type POZ protein-like [Trichogramma pretiosum]|uniref:speckle-type POZ protein-like n=1 Tax=Trichogramma pretiosum TaxID=7493 RepID=UPI000C71C8F7|nr:speckle-type POZ protein-like [Trichogramma pretiosum]